MSLGDLLTQFDEKIGFVRKNRVGLPRSWDINLAIAATDFEYNLAGNVIYVLHSPSDTEYIDVKLNNLDATPIRLYRAMGFVTPFDRLYITTPAGQTGNMTFVYGTEAPELLQIIDNRSSSSLGINLILDELRGDALPETWGTEITVNAAAAVQVLAANANRKACTVQAKQVNAGLVYLGFDNTVTTTKWFAELSGGMSFSVDDYRGPIWARASAAGQLVGFGEW